jgi:hypothetical protein
MKKSEWNKTNQTKPSSDKNAAVTNDLHPVLASANNTATCTLPDIQQA